MVQELTTQPSIFGRLGKGLAQGLSETVPKEVERYRLAEGLKRLGEQKDLTPFQQFSALSSIPGITPQMIQSGVDLLRQQAIINSLNQKKEMPSLPQNTKPFEKQELQPPSATTTESTKATLNPYIPPSGPEQEDMARRLMATEPQVYPTIESARAAVTNQINANIQQSNAKISKGELEEKVQNTAERKLKEELATRGAEIPGKTLSDLQQKAVDDIVAGKLSPDQAKIKYGEEADRISQDFSNIKSWGNLSLITKNPKSLINSMDILHSNAKKGGYQKQAADSLIAENGLTPQFAYATMYPVSDIKSLNEEIKSLPNIQPRLEKHPALPGLAGVRITRPKNANAPQLTMEIAPRLVRAMGTEGSPLAIAYELEKKGYDPEVWKQYIIDRQDELNLSTNQRDELQKPKPSFFGWLNDWWLKSFSGVK